MLKLNLSNLQQLDITASSITTAAINHSVLLALPLFHVPLHGFVTDGIERLTNRLTALSPFRSHPSKRSPRLSLSLSLSLSLLSCSPHHDFYDLVSALETGTPIHNGNSNAHEAGALAAGPHTVASGPDAIADRRSDASHLDALLESRPGRIFSPRTALVAAAG